ncbi:hypothetical protein Esti_002924 [Eimeria stiedai]
MVGSSGPPSKKPLLPSEEEFDLQLAPANTPPATAAPYVDAAAAPAAANEATEGSEAAAGSKGQELLGEARAEGLANAQQAGSSQNTGAGKPHPQDEQSQQQRSEVKGKKQKVPALKYNGATNGGSPLQQQQKQKRQKQPQQTEERLQEADRHRQSSVCSTKEAERPDSQISGFSSEVTPETSADAKSAADTATDATVASSSLGQARVYTLQQLMRYAVKSQRPYHPSIPLDAGQAQPVGLHPKDSQEPRLLEEPCRGSPTETHQQQGCPLAEGISAASGEVKSEEDSVGPTEAARTDAVSSGNTKTDETSDGQRLEAEAPRQGSVDSTEDLFRSCFCEPGFRLVQCKGPASGPADAPQNAGSVRKPRQPTSIPSPGAPLEETHPSAEGADGLSTVSKETAQLAARRRPLKHIKAINASTTQRRCLQTPQPAGECRKHKAEEAHPAWAGQGQGEELRSKGPPTGPSEEYATAGGPRDGDFGLAAFSMGDIRLAEKALEGGMTLEGYFRSVKGEDARNADCPPQRELEGATEALPGLQSYEQQTHQLPSRLEDDSRGLWSNELTCSPQATVGLGGVPLERDVEEEFSFLEETGFSLRSDARGKGAHPGKGGPLPEPTRARAQAAAAAAAAAAHAAAVAPSNPGAASVAAWFTTMLAASPESSNSPDWNNKAPPKAGTQPSKPRAEGGIINLLPQKAGQQIHQQQLYMQYQQRQMNQQQAMARHPRVQPLDAAQGREAGRQLLSLIGVVPRVAAEDSRASPLRGTTFPPSQGLASIPYVPGASEDGIPMAAAELGRQLLQRNYNLQQQQQMQQMQQQQAYLQHPQHQHTHMQEHRPYVQAPPVNPHIPPGASGPPLQPGRLPSRGSTPLGRLMEGPGEHAASSVIPNRPQVSLAFSGEQNLLKLLHAGGGPVHSSTENRQTTPPGRGGGGAHIKGEENGGPF